MIISCEKQYLDSTEEDVESNYYSELTNSNNKGIFSILPVDITTFNLLTGNKTKSSTLKTSVDSIPSPNIFVLESTLKWNDEQQLYFHKENILYRQIPLQMPINNILCKISNIHYKGKLTRVKSYCIIVESMETGILEKYLVTMFPEYNSNHYNEDCTFIEKGNFSGIIIFSTIEGIFQKIEFYKNGLIIPGSIVCQEKITTISTTDLQYLTIYVPSVTDEYKCQTKSLGGELDSIVVIGTRPKDSENKKKEGDEDGGSSTAPPIDNGGNNNEGGGGNYPSHDNTLEYNVTLAVSGNGTVTGGGRYTKNTTVFLRASCDDNTTFGGWVKSFEIESIDLEYSFVINSNCSYNAYFYGSDTECGRLAKKYKANKDLQKGFHLLDSIRIQDNSIEHGICKTNLVTNKYIEGETSSIIIPDNIGTYEYFIHSHPKNALIPSINDIYGIYLCYKKGIFNSESILFIQTYLGCLGLEIENISLLENFIKSQGFTNNAEKNKELFIRFQQDFHDNILGNPPMSKISDNEYSEKAIAYFAQYGIKMAKAHKDINNKNIGWAYAKQDNSSIIYKDCIQTN